MIRLILPMQISATLTTPRRSKPAALRVLSEMQGVRRVYRLTQGWAIEAVAWGGFSATAV